MPKRRVALSLDADLLDRADAKRAELGQSRTTFVERALDSALDFEDRLPRPPASVPPGAIKEVERQLAARDRQAKLNAAMAARSPGNQAAEKAKREAPPDRRVKGSTEARPFRPIPKAGKR